MATSWKNFRPGNIVRWNKSLWIVYEVLYDYERHPDGVKMISFDFSNCEAYITVNYHPDNEEVNLQSIQWVASNAKDLLERAVHNFLKEYIGDSK